jgi:putative FmdB family regulatory protein
MKIKELFDNMTYKYKCDHCKHEFKISCKMIELKPPDKCACGGNYYQIFGDVGIIWKTHGAYGKDKKK